MDSKIIEFLDKAMPKLAYLATPLSVIVGTTIPASKDK